MLSLIPIPPPAAFQRGAVSKQSCCRGLCLALLALALAHPLTECRSEDLGGQLQDFTLRTWTKADGLPDSSVTVIQQTQDGYLWVGTMAGLVRFDGIKFSEVPLPKDKSLRPVAVTALCQDSAGDVWIGSDGRGLFRWKNGQIKHFGAAEGLLDDYVSSLTLDVNGRLWIGTRGGVNRRDGTGFAALTTRDGLPDNSVSSVHAAKSGAVWITTAGGIRRFLNGRITTFAFPASGAERQEEYLGAYEDRRGNLWAFCATYIINLAGDKRINYFPGEKSATTRVWSLCEGRGGRLWIGASGRGVFSFDGAKFQPVTLSEGRWPKDVSTICEDNEGNLWLGISDGGLAQLRPQRFALIARQNGLPAGAPTCLMADAFGRLYAGMDSGGLYVSSGDRFEKITDSTQWLAQDLVSSACAQPDGSLWVGTTGSGLYHIKDGRSVVYSTANGLSDECVLAVCADPQGGVWAGTRAGALHRFKDGKVTTFTTADGLPGSPITALLSATSGGLWVGTESGALLRSGEQFTNLKAVQLPEKFVGKPILGLCEGPGQSLWIASGGGGLGCLKDNHIVAWDDRDGLLDNVVSGVVEDSESDLWLVLPQGLCRVASNSVASILTGNGALRPKLVFESAPEPDHALVPGWPRAVRSPTGRLWFATMSGLVGIDTHGWEGEKPAPQVHLEAVYVNNELEPMTGTPEKPLMFPAALRSLEFQFTGINFEAPEKIRFRHKLDGFDADWVETGAQRSVLYGRLPSGPYTFHVTACNASGVWNEQGESLAFIIPTPLWREPWALALFGLTAATAVAGAVRLVSHRRLRHRLAGLEQQQAMERERMRIARNMHDEIGSKLTKISFLSERLKVESRPTGMAGDKVDSIATASRDLLKALDEMVWAVNPRNDTLEHLASYLSHHATEYFQDTPVECHLRVQSQFPQLNMSAEFRHNIFLAFEESLSNVLKHARASRVEVQIDIDDETLRVRISDNGVGFSPSERNGHDADSGQDGLANMRQHLEDVGGSCLVESRPGQGTTVELRVALDSDKIGVS